MRLELIDPEIVSKPVAILKYTSGPDKTIALGGLVRGTMQNGQRPIALEWKDCSNIKPPNALMSWVVSELGNCLHPKAYKYIKSHTLIAKDMGKS